MTQQDEYEYNNEEEAEMAQLHSIHINMNAVADVQRKMTGTGTSECVDCEEPISPERKAVAPWCIRCVDCQYYFEKRAPKID